MMINIKVKYNLKIIFLTILLFPFIFLLLMNLTPGYFQKVGCCGEKVAYLTYSEAENTRNSGICGMVFCQAILINNPVHNFLLSLSNLDFYKNKNINNSSKTGLNKYTNNLLNYSFKYYPLEKIIAYGENQLSPEKSQNVTIVDSTNENLGIMSILLEIPPTLRNFNNEQEAIKEIFSYWSSSTSQYLSPELNKVTGPKIIKIKTDIGKLKPAYRYEIRWKNDPNAGQNRSGTDVWIFIPITVDRQSNQDQLGWVLGDYAFLWLNYDKQNENRLQTILNSLTIAR